MAKTERFYLWPDHPIDVRSDKEVSLYSKKNDAGVEKFYYRNYAGVIRELGGSTTVEGPRFVTFKKHLASWPHGGSWTQLDWHTSTVITTNDLVNTEDPWTTWDTSVDGTPSFTGDTFNYNPIGGSQYYLGTLKPGLYFWQFGALISPIGEDFMVGFETTAGQHKMLPFAPWSDTWFPFSSTLLEADAVDDPGIICFQRTDILSLGSIVGLNVAHLASADISADFSMSVAYLRIDPTT